MILLRFHKMVDDPKYPSFASYKSIGSIYGIDASSV